MCTAASASTLARHRKSFVNFGNGFEFAEVDEDFDTEATGIRNHVNVPMEKVVRDNSDHLFPSYNTHIPDAPSPPRAPGPGRLNARTTLSVETMERSPSGTCQ